MNEVPVRHFCTYFDSNYLARGLVLHQSLEEHSEGDFRLYVLCLDERVEEVLRELGKSSIVPIPLADVEQWDRELLEAKENRSRVEYYFTLSPVLSLYVLENFDCDIVTYLDADLMFFSSPEAIFDELEDKSIFITEHRFSVHLRERIKYGRFNVQCQSFRNDDVGLECLQRWRGQCLEWCYDRLEDGKFADQKYLDEWPGLYGAQLVISKHPGVGVAPWNVDNLGLEYNKHNYYVCGERLIFYHFHGLKVLGKHLIKSGLGPYNVSSTSYLRSLYAAYVTKLNKCRKITGSHHHANIRSGHSNFRMLLYGLKHRDLMLL